MIGDAFANLRDTDLVAVQPTAQCRACHRDRPLEVLLLVTGSGERFHVCRPGDHDFAPGRYTTCFREMVGNARRHAIALAA